MKSDITFMELQVVCACVFFKLFFNVKESLKNIFTKGRILLFCALVHMNVCAHARYGIFINIAYCVKERVSDFAIF